MTSLALSLLLSLTPPSDTLDLSRAGARPCTTAEQLVALLPFGAGQFLHGDNAVGVALATTQAAALAVNLGSYVDARGLERDRARGHVVAQYASLAVFGLLWSVSALQARSTCDAGIAPAVAALSLAVPAPPMPPLTPACPTSCDARQVELAPCVCPARVAHGGVQLALGGMWADVEVDGEQVLRHQMGAFSLDLPAGEHVLRFFQPRAHPEEVRLVVEPTAPKNRVVVRLRPLPAILRVVDAPEGALVRVAERRVLVGDRPVRIEVPLERGPRMEVVEILGPTGATLLHREVHLSPAQETTLALQPEP